MTNQPRSRCLHSIAAMALLGTLSCGGSAQQTPTTTAATAIAAPPVRPTPPVADTSEVPAPPGLLAVVRLASIDSLVERVGQLTGLGPQVRGMIDEGVRSLPGDPAIGGIANRNAPADFSFLVSGRSDVVAVVSFGGPNMEEAERLLGQTHRFVPIANGVRRIERLESPAASDQSSASTRMSCVIAPTPTPDASRIVCSEHRDALELATPYLARTLTRHEVPAYTVVADVAAEPLRQQYRQQALAAIDEWSAQLDAEIARDSNAPWRLPPVRAVVTRLAHEVFDNVRSVVNEGTALNTSLAFEADRVTWHTGFDMRHPSGSLLRAFADGARTAVAVPPELMSHLLPDGYVYGAGTLDDRPFRPLIGTLVELGTEIIQNEHALQPADVAAVRSALEVLNTLDQGTYAFAAGFNAQGELWTVATGRYATVPAAQWITGVRSFLAALRRPHVAALVTSTLARFNTPFPEIREIRELPTRGLPAGAFGITLPSIAAMAAARGRLEASRAMTAAGVATARPAARPAPARRGGAAASRATTQLLFVPNGQDLSFVLGPDVRALWTRYQANTTPGIDLQYLEPAGASNVIAFVPAGIPNSLRAAGGTSAADVQQAVDAMPDRGQTPVTGRLAVSETDGVTHFTTDLIVRRATLGVIPLMLGGSSGRPGMAPPPAPAP